VLLRLLSLFILAMAFSGCATSQLKTQNDQIESRLTDLEKSSQAKDAEIVDLQYQVKDLSSKLDAAKSAEPDQVPADTEAAPSSTEQAEPAVGPSDLGAVGANIVRVKVSAEKIQRALKSAGVYTGKVDGKIGPGTKEAIIEFQKSHGLKADGVLGRKTWEELKTYLK